jgi:hypothetical protein
VNVDAGLDAVAVEVVAQRVRALPRTLRELGLEPHPYGAQQDEEFGRVLERLWRVRLGSIGAAGEDTVDANGASTRRAPSLEKPGKKLDPTCRGGCSPQRDGGAPEPEASGKGIGTRVVIGAVNVARLVTASSTRLPGEEAVTPCKYLGVNNCHLYSPGDDKSSIFGGPWDIMADIAAAGGGCLRHLNARDLDWAALYPGQAINTDSVHHTTAADQARAVIPEPTVIHSRMVDHGRFTDLSRFTAIFLAAGMGGIRLIPTLFTHGGGTRVNDPDRTGLVVGTGERTDLYVRALNDRGVPPFEVRALLAGTSGWHAFYWQHEAVGFDPEDINDERYQRFAVNIYAFGQHDYDMGTYNKECARRKSLGIAAYGTAIGEYAAMLEAISQALWAQPITSVIPYFECGNEMETLWLKHNNGACPGDFTHLEDFADPLTGAPYTVADVQADGARQYGVFLALLTAPIALACPSARFATASLASAVAEGAWAESVAWLAKSIRTGLVEMLDFFHGVWSSLSCVAAEGALADRCFSVGGSPPQRGVYYWWLRTCTAAGFFFPTAAGRVTLSASQVVHCVGFHWYHSWDDGLLGDTGYVPQARLLDTCESFESDVVDYLSRAEGLSLAWMVTEVGFPASPIPTKLQLNSELEALSVSRLDPCSQIARAARQEIHHWFDDTSPLLQAAMLVRNFLSMLSAGASILLWHPHISSIAEDVDSASASGWTLFSTMGLRVDSSANPAAFDRAAEAWRRPSWYTFRRLVWLARRTASVRVLVRSELFLLVRLTAETSYRIVVEGESRTYSYAYVAWLDQEASGTQRFTLGVPGADYARLSLVPDVWRPAAPLVDENGYAAGDLPDWEWTGWEGGGTVVFVGSGAPALEVTLVPADGGLRSGPVCLFTNSASYTA